MQPIPNFYVNAIYNAGGNWFLLDGQQETSMTAADGVTKLVTDAGSIEVVDYSGQKNYSGFVQRVDISANGHGIISAANNAGQQIVVTLDADVDQATNVPSNAVASVVVKDGSGATLFSATSAPAWAAPGSNPYQYINMLTPEMQQAALVR